MVKRGCAKPWYVLWGKGSGPQEGSWSWKWKRFVKNMEGDCRREHIRQVLISVENDEIEMKGYCIWGMTGMISASTTQVSKR